MIHWEKLRLVVIFIYCIFPTWRTILKYNIFCMLHIENDIFLQWMIWSKYWFQCVTFFLFRCQRNFFFQSPFCPVETFKTQAHLKSHQTQKKCGVKKERKISPSNPFLKYFKAKPSPNPSPRIVEPPAEAGRSNPPGRSSRSFTKSDLVLPDDLLHPNADKLSPEYRETIRQFFDGLKQKFPRLTCADFALANKPRLKERTFQEWCSSKFRKADKAKIHDSLMKAAAPKDPNPPRRGRDVDREAKKQKLDEVKISNEKCFDNIINFIKSE